MPRKRRLEKLTPLMVKVLDFMFKHKAWIAVGGITTHYKNGKPVTSDSYVSLKGDAWGLAAHKQLRRLTLPTFRALKRRGLISQVKQVVTGGFKENGVLHPSYERRFEITRKGRDAVRPLKPRQKPDEKAVRLTGPRRKPN